MAVLFHLFVVVILATMLAMDVHSFPSKKRSEDYVNAPPCSFFSNCKRNPRPKNDVAKKNPPCIWNCFPSNNDQIKQKMQDDNDLGPDLARAAISVIASHIFGK